MPVYKSATNIRDILPSPDAVIHVDDYPDLTSLLDYVKRINSEEALYLKHTAWKKKRVFSKIFEHAEV